MIEEIIRNKKYKVNGITFTGKYEGYACNYFRIYSARKNGFLIRITEPSKFGKDKYYANIRHTKLDIRWNSLWSGIEWNTLHEALEYCSTWNFKNHVHACQRKSKRKSAKMQLSL